MPEPGLNQRVGAALFIVATGFSNTGIATRNTLTHPYTDCSESDVRRVAARLLASVYAALLAGLPHPAIARILKDQDAYLSFALGDGWPDESIPSAQS